MVPAVHRRVAAVSTEGRYSCTGSISTMLVIAVNHAGLIMFPVVRCRNVGLHVESRSPHREAPRATPSLDVYHAVLSMSLA